MAIVKIVSFTDIKNIADHLTGVFLALSSKTSNDLNIKRGSSFSFLDWLCPARGQLQCGDEHLLKCQPATWHNHLLITHWHKIQIDGLSRGHNLCEIIIHISTKIIGKKYNYDACIMSFFCLLLNIVHKWVHVKTSTIFTAYVTVLRHLVALQHRCEQLG